METVDGTFGVVNSSTGKWNGMIGMIRRGEVLFAIGNFGLRPSRARAVAYSVPPTYPEEEQITFYTPLPPFRPLHKAVFVVFRAGTWVAILVSVVAFSLACYALNGSKQFDEMLLWMLNPVLSNGICLRCDYGVFFLTSRPINLSRLNL